LGPFFGSGGPGGKRKPLPGLARAVPDAVLFTGGTIFTGAGFVEALAIENGRVVAGGPLSSVRRTMPTGALRVRLSGRTLVPGLIDAHLHLPNLALRRTTADIAAARSIPELVARLEAWADRHPDGPVVSAGWDHEHLAEHRFPTAADLDRTFPDRPVVIYRVCEHVAVVNSVTLGELALRATEGAVPPGVLYEQEMAPLSRIGDEWIRANPVAVRSVLAELSSYGLTTVATMSTSAVERSVLEQMAHEEPFSVQVRCYLRRDAFRMAEGGPSIDPEGAVTAIGLKVVLDGALGIRTAALSEPYADDPTTEGRLLVDPRELDELLVRAEAGGWAVAIHAIGDRALALALHAYQEHPGVVRPRIEHASLTPPWLDGPLDAVRPFLVVQPSFVTSDTWLTERLGSARARWGYAFRTLLARGHRLAGSSDAPVEDPNPWTGIRAAMSPRRRDPAGSGPEESLSWAPALEMYLAGAAQAIGYPGAGRLEVGSPADLVILDAPDVPTALERGTGPRVQETWKNGLRVFERAPTAPHASRSGNR
jgi:predicted amidohydrolase YtcJ